MNEGLPGATTQVITKLETELSTNWNQPRIAHTLVMQVNLVSPLTRLHENKTAKQDILRKMGINLQNDPTISAEFGREEATAYEQVFRQCRIDNLHVMTIGTTNTESNGYLLGHRVEEMTNMISYIFNQSYGHDVSNSISGKATVNYRNPPDCYWHGIGSIEYQSDYFYGINDIKNKDIKADKDWEEITDLTNLKLAWARARNGLLRESFHDEVEIRLFEQDLEKNLIRIREQLINYKNDIVPPEERIGYRRPKNQSNTRPLGLTRLEEEIISVAIIQKLGTRISSENSYAYRIKGEHSRQPTEYLYQHWWPAYQDFTNDARMAAQDLRGGIILQVDIKSFYEKIIQHQLLDATSDALRTDSERVKWLLTRLFYHSLEDHDLGLGITQGSIGSGFFANLYLSSVDQMFAGGNSWGLKFFRFVDDIILVIPNPDDAEQVLANLRDILSKIGLKLNENKIQAFNDTDNFLETIKPNVPLDNIAKTYSNLTELLWIMDEDQRLVFKGVSRRGGDEWWALVDLYKVCLASLGIYVSTTDLSRRIFKYLFNSKRRIKQLAKQKELSIPISPTTTSSQALANWVQEFESQNANWCLEFQNIRNQLVNLFMEIYGRTSSEIDKSEQRQLRFATYRLGMIGLLPISDQIVELLSSQSWIFRDPSSVIDDLASNGLYEKLLQLLEYFHHQDSIVAQYIRAVILRAIRLVPQFDATLNNVVVEYAVSPEVSIAEKLMATETMLYRRYLTQSQIEDRHIYQLQQALESEEITNHRLIKNFILLLGENTPQKYLQFIEEDHILSDASTLTVTAKEQDLFNYYEPDVLREEFYGGDTSPIDEDDNSSVSYV